MSEYYKNLGFVQIEILIDAEYGNFCVSKGDLRWTSKSDAEECVKLGLARIA